MVDTSRSIAVSYVDINLVVHYAVLQRTSEHFAALFIVEARSAAKSHFTIDKAGPKRTSQHFLIVVVEDDQSNYWFILQYTVQRTSQHFVSNHRRSTIYSLRLLVTE